MLESIILWGVCSPAGAVVSSAQRIVARMVACLYFSAGEAPDGVRTRLGGLLYGASFAGIRSGSAWIQRAEPRQAGAFRYNDVRPDSGCHNRAQTTRFGKPDDRAAFKSCGDLES